MIVLKNNIILALFFHQSFTSFCLYAMPFDALQIGIISNRKDIWWWVELTIESAAVDAKSFAFAEVDGMPTII